MSGTSQRWLRRTSWALMSGALILVLYIGTLVGYESVQQRRLASGWNQVHPEATIHDTAVSAAFPVVRPHLADGQPLAHLKLPSVGYDGIVTEGSDSGILSAGPGHEDHTNYPGEGGLILLSNHNGFSSSWGDLKTGAPVVVEMSYGRFRYTITKRFIVDGDDSSVLHQPHDGETLFLSTCWPLWAGAFAHQRLVFEAVPVSTTAADTAAGDPS